jgi:hypothetical protein
VADGSYAVEVPDGDYSLVFSDPSARYETQAADGPFTVTEGEATTASVALAPVRRIEGRIVDAGGAPVSGVCVYAYDGDGDTAGAYCTDTDGRWSISGLAAGSYRLGASDTAGAHQTVWVGGTSLASAQPVVLTDAAPVAAAGDVVTPGLGSAGGTVYDAQGHPLAGVCVYVDRADGSYAGVGTCTGADGTYWLGPLPEGSYTVAFYPPGSTVDDGRWYGGTADEASSTRIPISAGEVTGLDDQTF